jgi:dsDNA-specific endonuclease/ATPase MutS2
MTLREWLSGLASDRRRRREGGAREAERAADEGERDPFDPFPEPVELEITDVFDLHTVPPREVRRVVEAYLAEARRKGFRSVRIIHGKGRGVQRETVRAVLSLTPFVTDWADAPPAAGGWGATVAHLKQTVGGSGGA